jgi:vancomycin resistance protein VanJ
VDDGKDRKDRKGLLIVSGAYLAAVVCVLWARNGVAESTWWSTLLLYAPPVCFALPLVFLVPPAAFRRNPGTLLVLGVTTFLTLWPVMGAVAHDPLNLTHAGDRRVRLLAYNIHSGSLGWGRIAEQVRRFQPDVVVFSEARELKSIETLPTGLRDKFRGWQSVTGDDVFVASRWPIIAREVTPLGDSSFRSRVRATIRSPHGDFHVIGVHYYTHLLTRQQAVKASLPRVMRDSAEARMRQTRDVLAAVKKLEGPVLLAGDFNNPPAGHAYAMLRARFKDSHRRIGWGWGYTFPSAFPIWRIDYIFYDSWWNIVKTEVGPAPGSDHRPLFAEFSLDGNNNRT